MNKIRLTSCNFLDFNKNIKLNPNIKFNLKTIAISHSNLNETQFENLIKALSENTSLTENLQKIAIKNCRFSKEIGIQILHKSKINAILCI
jgi:hypothetical protein